ncbi:MAG: hemolysin family protein [candidate division WOR-3 bacterium]|nr:hemolysin family protein [candidate division WOR-3 bacterium]
MIIALLGVFLLLLIYFEAVEMSLVSSDEAKLSNLARKIGGGYKIASNFRRRPDTFFSTVLVGINLTTVLFSMLLVREIGIVKGWIISLLFISLIGEVLVKSFAIINPEEVASRAAPLLFFFYWLFYPLNFLVRGLGDGILKAFRIEGASKEKITKEEMGIAIKEAKATGGIEREQYTALRAISNLSQTDVRDIMVPRIHIKVIDCDGKKEDIQKILKETQVSKLPVYKRTIDNIIGILFKEDIIGGVEKWEIYDKFRPIKFIHGDRSLEEVLPELLSDKNGCAIVIDEYGGSEGFVSIDDILFSIFEGELDLEEDEEGTFIVDGSIRPQSLNIDTNEDTLAGFIVRKLEEIPHEGQKLYSDGMEMIVLDATERRIKKVLIKRESKNDV